ncbi:unnamed protein product [Amoebophrya sp. A25]|nr:unnamed protein product [Amoebophrya sp. A25]|eukprot:GSA25T00009951001.1
MMREAVEPLKILHTTSNYGKNLPGKSSTIDPHIGVQALWTYILPEAYRGPMSEQDSVEDRTQPCCMHHVRRISLPPAAFAEWAGVDDFDAYVAAQNARKKGKKGKGKEGKKGKKGRGKAQHGGDDEVEGAANDKWSLFFVNTTPGSAAQHRFHKYVLMMDSEHDQWAAKCRHFARYKPVEEVSGVSSFELPAALARFYREEFGGLLDACNEDGRIVEHVHVGILGGNVFASYVDENPHVWEHTLRPALPRIHQNGNEDPHHEDDFDFENWQSDGEPEESWQTVKGKPKAKDGCLPFCFESDENIFPDGEGIFRHYCRAEALWRCKRNGCHTAARNVPVPLRVPVGSKKKATDQQGDSAETTCVEQEDADRDQQSDIRGPRFAKNITDAKKLKDDDRVESRWFSSTCWFHEHLKDRESQNLRKGFERQYCNECWRTYGDCIEGKILEYAKMGSGLYNGKGYTGSDNPNGDGTTLQMRPVGRHQQDTCDICLRLKREQGFSAGCLKFSSWCAKGLIRVKPGSQRWSWAAGINSEEDAQNACAGGAGRARRRR